MSRVLVASGYYYRLDKKQWRDARPYPPLGTIQMAAVLRAQGHEVTIFDAGLRDSPEELRQVLERSDPDVVVIHEDGFNYLTKMCLSVMRDAVLRMCALAKAHGALVLVNSSDSTDHPDRYLEHGATVVVLGEGEATTQELIALFHRDEDISNVRGIAVSKGEVVRTPPRPILRDLDALPLPAWDLIDVGPYRRIWMASQGRFSLNVATTRGCPFSCNWCAKPIYGNRYNSRSPEHVVQELALLKELHAPDHVWMCDDIFGLKPGWVQEFRDRLRTASIRIPFKIQSRADLLLKTDTIEALAACGLEEVWIGAESGSTAVLNAMDKGITVEQIGQARRLLAEQGIRVGFFLQFGYPGEGPAEINATVAMLDRERPDDIGISVSYPLPGTAFHEKVKADLQEKANWTDSDDLAMLFRQHNGPAYYKHLHRYVHRRFRRKQAMSSASISTKGLAFRSYNLLRAGYHGTFECVHGISKAITRTG